MKLNEIVFGDAYELIKEIPDKSIDCVYTDVPYLYKQGGYGNSDLGKRQQKKRLELKENNLEDGFDYSLLNELVRVMKKVNIFIWCSKLQLFDIMEFFKEKSENFELMVWCKSNPSPTTNNTWLPDLEYCLYFRGSGVCNPNNYEDARTVFRNKVNKVDKFAFHHPTCKPVTIIETLIKNSSKENDLVLDCFLGSGTTAVACKNLKRDYIGIEINPKWYKVAKNRLDGCDANGQQSFILR